MSDYQTIINIGAGSVLAIMGWFARTLWDAVQELKTDLSKLREELAKDYVPKDDFKEGMSEIRRMFEIITTKLDNKADK
jgi:hypothetical protein